MDLINLLPHKRNTAVSVNGTTYRIDGDGVCRGVKDPDAAKMLQNAEAWRQWDGKTPTAGKKSGGGGIGLIASNGEIVRKADVTSPDLGQSELMAKVDQHEAEARGEANPPPSTTELTEPDEGEDWPDPTDKMPIDYLRKMADAYEVKYTKKTDKAALVKKIMAEMYPSK